jgi:hypothetical protein
MAISISSGDLYEIVLYGRFNSQVETRNTFSYRQDFIDPSTPANNDLFNVATSFWSQVLTSLRAITNVTQIYYQVEAKKIDLNNGDSVASEFYTIPSTEQAGIVTGDALPPQAVFTFQYVRPNSEFRHGYARFSGVSESMNVNGVIGVAANGTNQANALAAVLNQRIGVKVLGAVDLDAGEMAPTLVQKQFNGDAVRPLRLVAPATVRYSRIGSQNSRKYGQGS